MSCNDALSELCKNNARLLMTKTFIAYISFKKSSLFAIFFGRTNKINFSIFIHKSVRHRFLTESLKPFRLWLQKFAEIFVIDFLLSMKRGCHQNNLRKKPLFSILYKKNFDFCLDMRILSGFFLHPKRAF